MEKFLVKHGLTESEELQQKPKAPQRWEEIFTSQFELQQRTLVSVLELDSGPSMILRAKALLQRLKLRYGHTLSNEVQVNVGLMESALVTFLPLGEEVSERLGLQDRDFVDYWWRLLERQLRSGETSTLVTGATSSSTATDSAYPAHGGRT